MEYSIALQWVACAVFICFLIYKTLTKNHDYWTKQNVPFVKPYVVVGSVDLGGKPLHELEREWYNRYGRIYGRYDGSVPVLCVADPGLLKRVLVKDFHIFQNRRDLAFNDSIMDNTLFVLEGEAWKRVRNIVTPTLTSAKLRRMLPLLDECSDLLVQNLAEIIKKGQPISCQKMFSAFTIDAIGRCAFGMTINSLASEDDPFVAKANMLLQCFMSWRTYITLFFPSLMKLLRMKLLNPETTEFYKNIILQVVEERKKVHAVREDFLQMLLDAENESTDSNNNNTKSQYTDASCSKDSASGTTESKPVIKGLSHDECLSQCISFFIAGYDATTSLLSYVLYRMAMHQDHQDTVVTEIETALEKHDGILNYDTLSDLKFMDAVMNECLRLCPAMVRSDRRAERDYVFGDTNIVLKKGMLVSIPIYAIHRDPQWYPEPDVFKPERFYNPDPNRPQYVHLPFGAGPRACVGMRFVQMQVKMCLAKVLRRFHVHPGPTTPASLGYTEIRNILKVNDVEVSLSERVV